MPLNKARKKLLVSCNGLEENRVVRSVFFSIGRVTSLRHFLINFLFKNVCFMHVLCMFYVDWEFEGQKKP